MKTQLHNRVLWFDGTSEVNSSEVPQLLLTGYDCASIICEDSDDARMLYDITGINLIRKKEDNNKLCHDWDLPPQFLELEIESYLVDKLSSFLESAGHHEMYIQRFEEELLEMKKRNLEHLFRALVYVIEVLKDSGTVWGVGRGSACSSFLLFLIGIHLVDPVKYAIPASEFFHD